MFWWLSQLGQNVFFYPEEGGTKSSKCRYLCTRLQASLQLHALHCSTHGAVSALAKTNCPCEKHEGMWERISALGTDYVGGEWPPTASFDGLEKTGFLPLSEIEPLFLGSKVRSLVTTPEELLRFNLHRARTPTITRDFWSLLHKSFFRTIKKNFHFPWGQHKAVTNTSSWEDLGELRFRRLPFVICAMCIPNRNSRFRVILISFKARTGIEKYKVDLLPDIRNMIIPVSRKHSLVFFQEF